MMNNDSKPHFPERLQNSRLQRGWKQARLAEELGVKLRTLISWETGERVPTVGIVVRLGALLETDLLTPYIEDDLRRRYGQDAIREFAGVFPNTANSNSEEETHAQEEQSLQERQNETDSIPSDMEQPQHDQSQTANDANSLQSLFHIFEILQAQPALIPVALDFLEEMAD
jgi:transcriptional regulator with XRE-family HTH domain